MLMSTQEVKARLEQLGYEVTQSDEDAIEYAADSIQERIRNLCNQSEVPDELYYKSIDMACGAFLSGKMLLGGLDEYDESNGRLIKTISEGDTTVTYAEKKSCAKRVEELVNSLSVSDGEIICWRRLKW